MNPKSFRVVSAFKLKALQLMLSSAKTLSPSRFFFENFGLSNARGMVTGKIEPYIIEPGVEIQSLF